MRFQFDREHADRPIILALTGTDVYRDLPQDPDARKSLKLANRIIVLQPQALRRLTFAQRKKTLVIYQSVELRPRLKSGSVSEDAPFDVCVIGHLRYVKDPFRAAMASRLLPNSSRIRIIQIGGAMSKQMEHRARREMSINQRYRWRGELSRARALNVLMSSRLCVISSRMEGGANTLSEAITLAVPVLASRIDGNVGILGKSYPGLFRVGDTRELSQLMLLAENDRMFREDLRNRIKRLAPLFHPANERRAWAELIRQIV